MKITSNDIRNESSIKWAFFTCLAGSTQADSLAVNAMNQKGEVEFSAYIEGVEVDFEKVLNAMVDQYEKQVREAAEELLTSKVYNIVEAIQNIENQVNSHVAELVEALEVPNPYKQEVR